MLNQEQQQYAFSKKAQRFTREQLRRPGANQIAPHFFEKTTCCIRFTLQETLVDVHDLQTLIKPGRYMFGIVFQCFQITIPRTPDHFTHS